MPNLIAPDEPEPAGIARPEGSSAFFLTADHAGNAVPRALEPFGVDAADLARHIGIDIGILGVSRALSDNLDATLIWQRYSRLVVDCNRPPASVDLMPRVSDGTQIPANQDLSQGNIAGRMAAIFEPYHIEIATRLESRAAQGRLTVIIAMHSFTPHHGDFPWPRPWDIGVLFNRDARLARPLIDLLRGEGDLTVGINQPYAVDDRGDYGVPVHCEARGLLHVELEIRQDLIAAPEGQAAWARRLARLLPQALALAQTDMRTGSAV